MKLFKFLRKNKKMVEHRRQEFEARIVMERRAQREIEARLKAMELIADNQLRRKR